MLFNIDGDSHIPKYEQIVAQVIFGVASGGLRPGEMLPGVRDVALRHVVNFNTVAKAYQELERQGVVTARQGRGMEVTPEAPGLCRQRRKEIVQNRIRAALQEAVHSALTAEEVRRLVEEELARANGKRR
ncbi:MAG TPA: GntR family transcriptional regulator [Gemmataceae bacterium]|nr:GntR family transcriptional regulator [Gemmataceae bacterium]